MIQSVHHNHDFEKRESNWRCNRLRYFSYVFVRHCINNTLKSCLSKNYLFFCITTNFLDIFYSNFCTPVFFRLSCSIDIAYILWLLNAVSHSFL